jgi:methionine-rich copper-binding protein CopC
VTMLRGQRLAVVFTSIVAVLCLSLALPGVAAAHSVLVSTDPSRDSVLSGPPAQVSGTFNEPLQKLFPAMTIVGPDDNEDKWQAAEPTVSGAVISVPMKPGAPAGKYTVNYRVTSEDGHPVSGSWSFTVTSPGPPAGPSTNAAAPSPSAGASSAQTPNGEDDPMPMWPFVVGVIAAVGVALFWTRRRQS